MKKFMLAVVGLGLMVSTAYADSLQGAKWVRWQNMGDDTVYYRAGDAGSKQGVWLKYVERDDGDVEYKHYKTDCSGKNAVIKDSEVEHDDGALKRESDYDRVDSPYKADAIRSLICGK